MRYFKPNRRSLMKVSDWHEGWRISTGSYFLIPYKETFSTDFPPDWTIFLSFKAEYISQVGRLRSHQNVGKYFLFDQNMNWIISSSAGSYFQFNDSGHRETRKFISQHRGGHKHQVGTSFPAQGQSQQEWKSSLFSSIQLFWSFREVELSQGIYHVPMSHYLISRDDKRKICTLTVCQNRNFPLKGAD